MNYTELEWRWAMLLGVAVRDGLLQAVAERTRPAQEVARDLGFDARAVYVILSALAELGVLEEETDGFRLPEEHRGPLLLRDHPGYVGQSVVHRFELIGSWSRIPEILQTGEPVEDRTAPGFGGTKTFIAAMRRGAVPGAEAVAASVLARLPENAHILDVGGGPGTNAEAFVRSGARVTVFDRPEVVDLMRETLAASGIGTVAGDMNAGLPEGPFDAIYFGNTSHMYGPEENRSLFKRMRGSLVSGGLLIIREFVRGLGEDAALFAANMLVLTPRGGTYTAEQYEAWLSGSGYDDIEFEPVPGRSTHLIFARATCPEAGGQALREEVLRDLAARAVSDPGFLRHLRRDLPGALEAHGYELDPGELGVSPSRPSDRPGQPGSPGRPEGPRRQPYRWE